MTYGYVAGTTTDGHQVVVGPFDTRAIAETLAKGQPVIEWTPAPGPGNPCEHCGAEYVRLPMPDDTARVYDALFPAVLDWSEDDDCGMAALMLNVAETAAAALRPGTGADR